MFVFDDSPINPFNEHIQLKFPVPGAVDRHRRTFTTSRYTAGMVADLPIKGWRGTAEMTFGSTRAHLLQETTDILANLIVPPFGPDINPLGNWDEFQREIVFDTVWLEREARARNRYRETSVRLAGPLVEAGGGPVTLTLLAERRSERVPAFTTSNRQRSEAGSTVTETEAGARSNRTTSFYGELRAPIFGDDAPLSVLRGLEVQLAVRRDRLRAAFDRDPFAPEPGETARHDFRGTSYTIGAKLLPAPWLMVRASYATGQQAPPLELLVGREEVPTFLAAYDPKRWDANVGSEAPFLRKYEGSPEVKEARANTLSLGAVLNPSGRPGPRVSVEYSRIRKLRAALPLSAQLVLDHEEVWPERVTRAPLTDEDRARGYSGGVITMLDERAMNGGGAKVDSIDARIDWPMPVAGGELRLYGAATLQMGNKQRRLFEPDLEQAGYRTGPLKWRANGGADWSIGATTLGANVQFFSRYRIVDSLFAAADTTTPAFQGSGWVRSQTYVDLHASRRFELRNAGPLHGLEVNFGIINLFDKAPPRETGYPVSAPGYSRYGDPRGRRFELVLSSEF